jgi:hypothetical protein
VLLHRKRNRLVRETGDPSFHTEFDSQDRTIVEKLRVALTRPFRLIATQLIVQVLALYMMYLYGLLYLQFTTFPSLWTTRYDESLEISGLNFIAQGVGLFLGAQLCAPLQDRIYVALKKRYNVAQGRPEFRIPMMIPGAISVPLGLLIYGWSAQRVTHWIVPDIGVAIFNFGVVSPKYLMKGLQSQSSVTIADTMNQIVGFQCIQGYFVDTYTRYAASAVAAGTVLRSIAGFGFPLFGQKLFDALDYGWGNTVLALIAVSIGWPAPLLLWRYGPALRKKSPFAIGKEGA